MRGGWWWCTAVCGIASHSIFFYALYNLPLYIERSHLSSTFSRNLGFSCPTPRRTVMTGDCGKAFTAWKNHPLSTNRVRVALLQTQLAIWEQELWAGKYTGMGRDLTERALPRASSSCVCARVRAACVARVLACRFCNTFHACRFLRRSRPPLTDRLPSTVGG